ncbi:Outer membrane protein assembly factor BamA [Aquimarina amphilecti]|uniref:Outer membrane protein assembly factor BamA n=1 Tax=Aquimarina amphilecti TaxID=1038014 RepID=A0A1H7UNX4_AQUAM|nr:ShlB/FhaC/HecB family hemolysin secretion/activation protein [Aquimarina amphilecti]SEL98455.1 Outer membrane protein assembly factor BamA [Aquimarina amphilecti]
MKTPTSYIFLLFIAIHSFCNAQNTILNLTIQGIDSTETSKIDSTEYTKTFKNFIDLKTEVVKTQKTLLQLGYLDSQLLELKKTSDSSFVSTFELNKKYKNITIHYNKNSIPIRALKQISTKVTDKHFSIPLKRTEEVLQFLTNFFVDQGNTFSNLSLTDIKKDNDNIIAKLINSTSNKRTIDDIIIKGYSKFPYSYLKYNSRIRKGATFNKNDILKKSLTIDNLGFAKSIKAPEVLFGKDSTKVYLYLKKKTANSFDGFLGFSTDTESGNLELNGYLDLKLINNLNFGEKLNLIYKSDGNEQQRFQANISLPYILKTPIGIEAGIEIFKKDSSFLITEQNIDINYLINNKDKISVGYSSISSNNLLDNPQPLLNINDYNSSFFTLSFNHTLRQNKNLFPIKNSYSLRTELGSRNTENNKTTQIKSNLSLSYIFELNQRNSISLKNSAAIIFSDDLFVNELFRFGGINSIRGFEENSINASLFNVLNTEYQYTLSPNLYIHSIIDYSYFEDETNKISDNLTSFGIGIGLNTQTGLFRIIFANGKNSDSNFKFSNTKVHISLNAIF